MKNFYKLCFLLYSLLLLPACIYAQAPQAISYQGVARNTAGNLLASQAISLRFTIHDVTAGGTIVYRETQSATTNTLGLFSVNIGQGTVVSGVFATINWGGGSKFLQVEMDASGGTTYINMGTQQMLSVPYALSSGDNKWTSNGTAVYNNNSGNVGIGTTSPAQKLEVVGTTKTTNLQMTAGAASGKVLGSDVSGNASWQNEADPKVASFASNRIPKWNGTLLTDGQITDNGTSVGINNTAPSASALLDLSSTNQGLLVPRMTSSLKTSIVAPAPGLLIYQTDAPIGFWYYNGAGWVQSIGVQGPAGPAPSGTGIVTVNGGTLNTPSALSGDVTTTGSSLVTAIGANKITSAMIVDGTVTNADIANSTIDLTSKVTGVLPTANGGYGSGIMVSAIDAASTTIQSTITNYANGNITITVPAAGKIIIDANVVLLIHHATAVDEAYTLLIGTSPSDNYGSGPYWWYYGYVPSSAVVGSNIFQTCAVKGFITAPAAGTYTLYLNGWMSSGQDAGDQFYFSGMTATFYR